MKTLATWSAADRAAASAFGQVRPCCDASPAAHTQHATANDAVPESTILTGTGLESGGQAGPR